MKANWNRGFKTTAVTFAIGFAVVGVAWVAAAMSGSLDEDSGVAACKAMADKSRTVARYGDTPMSAHDYWKLRKVFSDSTADNLRTTGTRFVDVTWQIAQIDKNDPQYDSYMLIYANQIVYAYNNLATACADNGVTMPSLAELTEVRQSAQPVPSSPN